MTACPSGNKPQKVKAPTHRHTAVFNARQCAACPNVSKCCVKQGKRGYYLNYDDKALRCAQRRALQQTDEFRERYRFRAGVKATMSSYDRCTGVKQLKLEVWRRFGSVPCSKRWQ